MIRTVVGVTMLAGAAWGQQFEVASIHQQEYNAPGRGGGYTIRGGQVNATTTLDRLIMAAYNVRDYQVSGGPSWIEAPGPVFVITAKPEGDIAPAAEQVRPMLQNLLADRFQLKLHRETKDLLVYDLVVAKSGLKMKETPADSQGGGGAGNGRLRAARISMAMLALALTPYVGRPVIDKTGLTANYSLMLEWAADNDPDPGPSIFKAIAEQLGLKLEPSKAATEILVIDHVEKPSEN